MKSYIENPMWVRKVLEKEILQWPKVSFKEMMGCLCYFRGKRFFAFPMTKRIVSYEAYRRKSSGTNETKERQAVRDGGKNR